MKRTNHAENADAHESKRSKAYGTTGSDSSAWEDQSRHSHEAQSQAFLAATEDAARKRVIAELALSASQNVALENAKQQLAVAVARHKQTEEALRQCKFQQEQAAAMVSLLQQQAGPAHLNLGGIQSMAPQFVGSQLQQPNGLLTAPNSDDVNSSLAKSAGMFNAGGFQRFSTLMNSGYQTNPNAGDHQLEAARAALNLGTFSMGAGMPTYPFMLMGAPTPFAPISAPTNLLGLGSNSLFGSTMNMNPSQQQQQQQSVLDCSTLETRAAPKNSTSTSGNGVATHDPGNLIELSLPSDKGNLSDYQCLLRQQIVLFSVSVNDIQCSAQGRNKPICMGQVGVLCRHCAKIPPGMRPCGAAYFPAKLSGIYQASQNMAINHFSKSCRSIPEETRALLIKLKEQKSTVLGGGKNFWANGARVIGVCEAEEGHLRFMNGN